MATFLFDKIVFGPVISRRLGISLGVNLLPVDSKICSFDCIYCECGRNPQQKERKNRLPSREEVKNVLESTLKEMQKENRLPETITFAGNGEPTLHPEFEGIIDDTIVLRNRFAPQTRIAVLSNATMLHKPGVIRALLKVEDNIQKLDSAIEKTIRRMNCPASVFKLTDVIENLKSFNGKVIIQTMFLRGIFQGEIIDNTTREELSAWLKLIAVINPSSVMIYTTHRDTPTAGLEKAKTNELQLIADQVRALGFPVQVSG